MIRLPKTDPKVQDICKLLSTSPYIGKINFCFNFGSRVYKVYPAAFRKDVMDKIAKGDIGIVINPSLNTTKNNPGKRSVAAQYNWADNDIHICKGFLPNSLPHQEDLMHECTHAHFDIQAIGKHPKFESEAVAYVAGDVYKLGFLGKSLLSAMLKGAKKSTFTIETYSYPIAVKVLQGTYNFANQDLNALLKAVAIYYQPAGNYNANGVGRRH
jgi:hypothetical protein